MTDREQEFAFELVHCTYETHGLAILAILNDVIGSSTALFEYEPRSLESMSRWFEAKHEGNFPVIAALTDGGEFAGFATYGHFRPWPAYKYSVEHSVYVHKAHRGRRVGTFLMRSLITMAQEQQYHVLIGGIDAANTPSIALHEKLGFVYAGTIRQAGFKFGRWLDLVFYQLLLGTPTSPSDG